MDAAADIVIFRPRREVAAFIMDPRNDPLWGTSIESARPLQPGPLVTGARVEQISKAWGVRSSVIYEVTSIEADHHMELHVADPVDMWMLYELDDTPGGTLVRARTKASMPQSFAFKVFSFLARWNLRRDLRKLKRHLERAP
ncbi:polyketide cyclase / dehydrase and lipid transport [Variibacter gotjawalensis]|uniref:Polyketide cyclase / dehydrase and lipid transport n=1 Tax=Variibacter gotjawalensis TaxID=1333996 RepID=A0A0S3PP26_9BRAD|nr:SRPBCC family protein [Variibacter gotjawalensis]NIK47967.1 hypothetical protein [Variibacter gotjawalensis]RZS49844.1 polyketide cyclase/dehydrase/lipid transport protein [Variibacter gotjawalensis]BAT57673.1 polyketide cyclase / dehydrase and lipid transport [Variibacter gotjawalensis]